MSTATKTDKDGFSDLGTAVPSSSTLSPADALPGTGEPASTYQHYQVLRRADGSLWELGRGAMGITYKAFDVNLRCDVALKVVNAAMLNHPNARERFVREARAAARLRHRNVATVYHLGNDGEHFFYAMEFIDGETLEALVRRDGPLSVPTALRVVLQAARALAAAARQGLVHRDIKPANIMLAHEDADDHAVVKVIDFGLVRPTFGDGSGSLTIGGFVGTPQYASPEQLEEQPVDTRSDIYSLGVTLWFLLAGQPPFVGSLAGICDQHRHAPPPWEQLPALAQQAPVRELLAHMLEKTPANRPQDAVELRREAEACLAGILGRSVLETADEEAGLPAVHPEDDGSRAAVSGSVAVGSMLLGGRYELVRLIDESDGSRVFQARDRKAGGRLAAVKQRRAGSAAASPGDVARLEEEVRQARAAPHPCLVEIYGVDATTHPAPCVVEEWINGFTLLDLLAVRGGGVSPPEGLCLLQQAAQAVDHARRHGLGRLGLALHQLRLHFPGSLEADAGPDARAGLRRPMPAWEPWTLKIDPLGGARSQAESATWAGEATLLPGAATLLRLDDSTTGPDLRALAMLIYELLGGTPPPPAASDPMDEAGRAARYASLPALNEEANAVLRRALTMKTAFASGREFFETLARSAGFRPESLDAQGGGLAPGSSSFAAVAPLHSHFDNPSAETFVPAGEGAGLFPGKDLAALPMGRRERAALSRRRRFWMIAAVWGLLLCVSASALMWRQRRLAASQPRPPAVAAARKGAASPAPSPGVAARKPVSSRPAAARPLAASSPAPTSPKAVAAATPPPLPKTPVASTPPPKLVAAPIPSPLPKPVAEGAESAAISSAAPVDAMPPSAVKPSPVRRESIASGADYPADSPPPVTLPPAPALSTVVEPPPPVLSAPAAAAIVAPTPAPAPAPKEKMAARELPPAPDEDLAVRPPPPSAKEKAARELPPPLNEDLAVKPPPAPPAKEKTVRVRVESTPAGAEISFPGEAPQKAPMEIRLAPGDHELVARYKDWADVRYQFHLSKDKREAKIEIGMVPPVAPSGTVEPPAKAGRSWLPHFGRPRRASAPPPLPPKATEPGGVDNGAPVPAGEAVPPRVLRALPKTEPFEPSAVPAREVPVNSAD